MSKYFLNKESSEIINELTDNPFAIDNEGWLYWLFRIELIPGSWDVEFWLENTNHRFSGHGLPDEAVKMAYERIDKEWLEKVMKDGKEYMRNFERNNEGRGGMT